MSFRNAFLSWLSSLGNIANPTSTSTQSPTTTQQPQTTAISPTTTAATSTNTPATRNSPTATTNTPTATSSPQPQKPGTVDGTVLVLARDSDSAYSATSGLDAYGIPYQLITVPQSGIQLPELNSSTTQGNYGGILTLSELSYEYSEGWHSALTQDQYQEIYDYQKNFKVRMVRLDAYPGSAFGCTTVGGGCCGNDVEQLISFTNTSGFPTANIKANQAITHKNMWHYPAKITDPGTTWEVAKWTPDASGKFTSDTTAAVINQIDGREQMVWFNSWATEWSVTSNFLQHAFIHWMTRGLFVGARKVYLSTQVDDVHLTTDIYSPAGTKFRIGPNDVDYHINWMRSVNSRLPAGSNYVIELGHNGNGDIINATLTEPARCNPTDAIYYDQGPAPPLEYQKPLGTGSNVWPNTPSSYSWSYFCARQDDLASWFMSSRNRDAFYHVSHTFSHMNLNNATYSDASKEITFNQAWARQMGFSSSSRFSPNGLIPPAITGLHNGDVIRAWIDNGITQVVGDNSRPVLTNQAHQHWPLISNVADNGYAGLTIVPRWSTAMFYNCDLPDCTSKEWVATSGGWGGFDDLVQYETTTSTRRLFGLHHDPYMFHQANLRSDVPSTTVGSQTGRFSLLQTWVEAITQEMTRLTNWPMTTLKHDDLAQTFSDRMARDQCTPSYSYSLSSDRSSITGMTVSANGNSCSVPIPATFPGSASTNGRATSDKVGSEPLIMWTTLSGSPVSFTLSSPIKV